MYREPDYDAVYDTIVRRIRRLVADCGYHNVLNVLSMDMPEHREANAEREERERQERHEKRRAAGLKAAETRRMHAHP